MNPETVDRKFVEEKPRREFIKWAERQLFPLTTVSAALLSLIEYGLEKAPPQVATAFAGIARSEPRSQKKR